MRSDTLRFDLHNHSTYSDGKLSVNELILLAKEKGLAGLALTDHDCVFGLEEGFKAAKEQKLFFLNGVEVSTFYKGQTVHIVTFFKHNKVPQAMYDYSLRLTQTRIERAKKMLKLIEDIYHVNIDYDYIYKSGSVITRGNMFQAIMRANPNLDKEEASAMVSNDSKAYIPASKLDTVSGLKMIHDCGGIAILAHPTLIKRELLEEIIKLGFEGIESRYPLNKEGEEEYFRSLASKYNLVNSAGSDYHGDFKHADLGTSTVSKEELEKILKLMEVTYED